MRSPERVDMRESCLVFDDLLKQIETLRQREAHLREALEFISFASNVCPSVLEGKAVPEKYRAIIKSELRHLGKHAEQALSEPQP